MLTRLKVDGFKNLVGVDLGFGPFTCIAGINGVGKSNVFDAISFLSSLADTGFVQAAANVRADDAEEGPELRDLFFRASGEPWARMRFECEFLVSERGVDDLGQPAEASSTFLRYTLELRLLRRTVGEPNRLELVDEELVHINKGDAVDHLPFATKCTAWRNSVVMNRRTGGTFISTEGDDEHRTVKLSQDGRSYGGKKSRGRPVSFIADRLPRTVLSSASAIESPTALLARLEMRSWRRLQLESSAMRRSDRFDAPTSIGVDGRHLARTLQALATEQGTDGNRPDVMAEIAARLSELVNDIREVDVDVDQVRRRMTLRAAGRDGVRHSARALSDGTLRFLALAIIELGRLPEVICLEEPENGIHPSRIDSMLKLLMDIAVDTSYAVNDENPLRQVLVNTHSPGIVAACPIECVVFVESAEKQNVETGGKVNVAAFRPIAGTWRDTVEKGASSVLLTDLLAYLDYAQRGKKARLARKNVREYAEMQLKLAIGQQ